MSIAFEDLRLLDAVRALPLAGSALFTLGAAALARRGAGDVVYVAADTAHGFRTEHELLVVFYLWQAGDLRQTSSFE